MEFGPSGWKTPDAGMQREWLLTNGLGGYASTALTGANARRYHGLLVAAPGADRERQLVLSQISEAVVDGGDYTTLLAFHTREQYYRGEEFLYSFQWKGMPVWRYRIGRLTLEKQVLLVHHRNQVLIRYRIWNGNHPVSLHLTPLVNFRNHHFLSYNQYTQFQTDCNGRRMCVHPFASADVIRIDCSEGILTRRERAWFYNMDYPLDRQRGEPATEDHFLPGTYEMEILPGAMRTVTLSVSLNEPFGSIDADVAMEEEMRRLADLPLARHSDAFVRSLAQAADQFVVCHPQKSSLLGEGATPAQLQLDTGVFESGRIPSPWGVPDGVQPPTQAGNARCPDCDISILAGYPWIGAWGRDTLIALPGLLLLTGRHHQAGRLLRMMGERVTEGLLANPLLPDRKFATEKAVDGPLWLFEALWRHVEQTRDMETAACLLPVLEDIASAHAESRVAGMFCDTDGLLGIADATEARTWMNARVGNWIVTPRTGKPVEINALWYNALRVLAGLRTRLEPGGLSPSPKEGGLPDPEALAHQVRQSFGEQFWNPHAQCLYDVCGLPQPDASIRPNQVLACSLSFPVFEGEQARLAMETVFRRLHVPLGLRSLAADDDRYKGRCVGDVYAREGAMHQGTAWPWLLGPFATAWRRTHRQDADADAFLEALFLPVRDHLRDGCLGTVSELLDGDFPHEPRGCVSQAWSVAEVLRGYLEEVVLPRGMQLTLPHPHQRVDLPG
jgi:glycogen debranching enzyme